MNYGEILDYIHSLGNFSHPAGLDRIKKALSLLGDPQKKIKAIHIAGTNGKGSVSAMLGNVFKTAGFRTGLFISPYIIEFCERIQINGEFISKDDLISYALRVKKTNVELTEFEFITALAFLYFKEQEIDVLICETGLGGRLDATNTLDNLIAGVITKIGLDHTSVLGDSIEKIAEEKCGILRKGITVTSPYQQVKALDVIKQKSDNLIIPDTNELYIKENSFIYCTEEYKLSLKGDFQIENALIVIETVKNCGYDIPYDVICEALSSTFFPARMEMISKRPPIILDGAHNPDGAAALKKEMVRYKSITAVIGMCKDKNYKEFLNETLPLCENAVCVTIDNPRALNCEELKKSAEEHCKAVATSNVAQAYETALELSNGNPIFIFGSLYLASEIRPILMEKYK